MNKHLRVLMILTLFTTLLVVGLAYAQGIGSEEEMSLQTAADTAFTYQGQLRENGRPVNGTCDFRFKLYNAATGGSQVRPPRTKTGVNVTNGLFTVSLDFGSGVFNGDARWLEVAVRCPAGSGTFKTLSPRQPIRAVPYALYSLAAPWSGLTGIPAGFADGVDNDTTYTAGTGLTLSGTQFRLNTAYTDGRYWKLGGNSGTNPATHFLGTTDAVTLTLAVSGTTALRLAPTTGTPNIIGGYSGNTVAEGVVGATIGGGGESGHVNQVTANYGTVGGGVSNTASGDSATVGGGRRNHANANYATVGGGGDNTAQHEFSTVGGGWRNWVSGYVATVGGGYQNHATGMMATVAGGQDNFARGRSSTVGGGYYNTASGNQATVGGGRINTASGFAATVPGGAENEASGDYSFAAGHRAKALHDGSFVLADATDADFPSSWANQFRARFTGGFTFVLDSNIQYWVRFRKMSSTLIQTSTGASLTLGGRWQDASDRNLKENFTPVDPEDILQKVAQLPITSWNYKVEGPGVKHIGPVAQDFYALFGVGTDDKHIAPGDANGVALAAIQGLYRQNRALQAENTQLRTRVEELERVNAKQQAQIQALQQQLADLAARLAALERKK